MIRLGEDNEMTPHPRAEEIIRAAALIAQGYEEGEVVQYYWSDNLMWKYSTLNALIQTRYRDSDSSPTIYRVALGFCEGLSVYGGDKLYIGSDYEVFFENKNLSTPIDFTSYTWRPPKTEYLMVKLPKKIVALYAKIGKDEVADACIEALEKEGK